MLFVLIIDFSFQQENRKIARMYEPSVSKQITKKIPHIVEFKDTLQNDTLWEHLSTDNFPVMYSRKITAGVCLKKECRPVHIELFWNCTGRYLGFILPDGEFLSKTEHVKFNEQEYDRLHEILSDRNSPLANYALEELVVTKDTANPKVDAVSSATIKAMLEYSVEGAVFTTYTLWHIVYGPTRRETEKLTAERMTDKTVLELLKSKKTEDQIWMLNHISAGIQFTPELLEKFMQLISGSDVYLAERSLNAIRPETLTSEVQKQLLTVFDNVGFLQKRFILQKLKEASRLNIDNAITLSVKIDNENAALIKLLIELFEIHEIDNERVNSNISKLLKNKNRYVSELAYNFLEHESHLDNRTIKSLEKYKRN